MSHLYGSVFVGPNERCKVRSDFLRFGSVSVHFDNRTSAEIAALLRSMADELDPPRRAYGWTLP
jgi:hypothetical protein